jgi:hypothetical protein
MTRRKREITGLANEQDLPHLVELAVGLPGSSVAGCACGRLTARVAADSGISL